MEYHLLDANNKILGRLAVEAAGILRGKNKPGFAPNVDGGDAVVIINSGRISVTGNKRKKKVYHRFSGYPGGITSVVFEDQLKNDSRKIIRDAVYGMLPKNKLRDLMMKRLFVYKNDKHPHKINRTD